MTWLGCCLVIVNVALMALDGCSPFRIFKSRIPNGQTVHHPCDTNRGRFLFPPTQYWSAVGHQSSGGGGLLNNFGRDFQASSHTWTVELCRKDSDGDGLSNGFELGDPDCTWRPGLAPSFWHGLSHPGVCDPVGSERCAGHNAFLRCSHEALAFPQRHSAAPQRSEDQPQQQQQQQQHKQQREGSHLSMASGSYLFRLVVRPQDSQRQRMAETTTVAMTTTTTRRWQRQAAVSVGRCLANARLLLARRRQLTGDERSLCRLTVVWYYQISSASCRPFVQCSFSTTGRQSQLFASRRACRQTCTPSIVTHMLAFQNRH